jgi:hypothetical protein
MKRSALSAVALAALLVAMPLGRSQLGLPFGTSLAQAQEVNVNFSIFFGDLAQHGRWVHHPRYKNVWCPDVDQTWAPYTHGHWVYLATRGWYFESDEPFAWAAYHYGRWFREADLGWCWVPGNVWAPAWVSWRKSNEYLGWAPLAPDNDGYSIGVKFSDREPPRNDWFFVPTRSFLKPQLSAEIVFGASQPDVFDRTQAAGTVIVQNNIVVNNVITVNFVEQQTNEKVAVVKAQPVTDPNAVKPGAAGQDIAVFDAELKQPQQNDAPKQAVDLAQAVQDKKAKGPAAQGGTATSANGTPAVGTDAAAGAPAAAPATTEPAPANAAPGAKATDTPPANAAAGAKADVKAGTPTTCATKDMIDGVCPPEKGKPKPAEKSAPAAAAPAEKGAGTTNENVSKPAGAAVTATPPAPDAKPASTPEPQAVSPKVKPTACPANEVLDNGACKPAEKAKPESKPSTTAQPVDKAPVKAGNDAAPADTSADQQKPARSPKGKAGATCPAGEELVKGECVPKGQSAGAKSDATPVAQ